MKNLHVVTGSSGGIGHAIVQSFLKKGHAVIGIDKHNGKIEDSNYTHFNCDVTDFEKLQKIIERIDYGDNNSLINCAGIREICSISDLSFSKWEEVMSVNVSSVFVASKTFAEKVKNLSQSSMRSIVNIASVSGLLGEPNRTAYVTSKHAVIGLTKQLAIEYGKFGIRANAVAPGVVRTPLTEQYFDDTEQLKKISAGQFVNYFATPADIVPLILFLTTENSQFITGSTLTADGGWSAGKII